MNTQLLNNDAPKTKVIIREWEWGGLIAFFPEEVQGNGMISSYEHVGQHSAACPSLIEEMAKPTLKYAKLLLEELDYIGYNLDIVETYT